MAMARVLKDSFPVGHAPYCEGRARAPPLRHALTTMVVVVVVVFDVSLCIFLSLAAGTGGDSNPASTSNCYDGHGRPIRCEPPKNSFSLGIIPEVDSVCGSPPTGFVFVGLISKGKSSQAIVVEYVMQVILTFHIHPNT